MLGGVDFPPADEPPTTTITRDLSCLRCGYSLRGLARDALCPECGDPVSRTLVGDVLAATPLAYRRRLYRGARVIWWAGLGAMILAMGGPIVIIAGASQGLPDQLVGGCALVAGFGVLGAVVAFPIGWFILTGPDPSRLTRTTLDRAALWTRVSVIVGAVWFSLNIAGVSLLAGRTTGIIELALSFLPLMLLGWHSWMAMHYVSLVAARVPDPRVQQLARTRRITVTLWATLGLFLCGVGVIAAPILYLLVIDALRAALKPLALAER